MHFFPDDGSGYCDEYSSFFLTPYQRDVPEIQEDGSLPYWVNNYTPYDLLCLKNQLCIYCKNINREYEPCFFLRTFGDRRILTVEFHHEGELCIPTNNFYEHCQDYIDIMTTDYRYYLPIYDNSFETNYNPQWVYQLLTHIPWLDNFDENGDVDSRPIVKLEKHPDQGNVILMIDIRSPKERKRSQTNRYLPNEEVDFSDRRRYFEICIANILKFCYSQGTIICDYDFASKWNLSPVSWSGLNLRIVELDKNKNISSLKEDITMEVANDIQTRYFTIDENNQGITYSLDPSTERIYMAKWDNNFIIQNKTSFLQAQHSGKNYLIIPLENNLAERHYILHSLSLSKSLISPEQDKQYYTIFQNKLIINCDNYYDLQKIVSTIIWSMGNAIGQVSYLKYSSFDQAQEALNMIQSDTGKSANIKPRPDAMLYKNDDLIFPWMLSFSIDSDEEPMTVSQSIRTWVHSQRSKK
jgi:hypothetical protein